MMAQTSSLLTNPRFYSNALLSVQSTISFTELPLVTPCSKQMTWTCTTCGGEHHSDECRFYCTPVCEYIPNCKFFPKCNKLHRRCYSKMDCRDIKCQYYHNKQERKFRRQNRHLLVNMDEQKIALRVVESSSDDEDVHEVPPPRKPLPNLSAGCLDPCLARHHIPIELRRNIDSYFCEPLTDENIRIASLGWCIGEREDYATSERYRESYLRFGHISLWDTSKVTDMGHLFSIGTKCYFDENIEYWDVSKVTSMHAMFDDCRSFNHSLSRWNVSACTDMQNMFWRANSFNQPLSTWDVSKVTDMGHMFGLAISFKCHKSLYNWNVSKLENVRLMFYRGDYKQVSKLLTRKWRSIVPDSKILDEIYDGR